MQKTNNKDLHHLSISLEYLLDFTVFLKRDFCILEFLRIYKSKSNVSRTIG